MTAGYVILKLMYHLCIIMARYIIEAIPPSFWVSVKKRGSKSFSFFSYLKQRRSSEKTNGVISL